MNQAGNRNGNWKGGRHMDNDGYILIHAPNHPQKNCDNYVPQHRLIIEKEIGRYLTSSEIVHHKNGNKSDNSLSNLKLMDQRKHIRYHALLDNRKPPKNTTNGRWAKQYDACLSCGRTDRKHGGNGLCSNCYLKNNFVWSAGLNTYVKR